MNAEQLVKTLNSQLEVAQTAYYDGSPILSDAEYDTLEAQLSALIEVNPQFASFAAVLFHVGNTKNSLLRIKHERPMLSIENYYTKESYCGAAKSYGVTLLEEPKRDGISCELFYKNGRLIRAVSRGDGESGEDMTEQIRACKAIPQFFVGRNLLKNIPSDLRIRGELVMRQSELARINALGGKQFSNPRNTVSGTMKQKDLSVVASREILLMPWDMYSPDQDDLLPDSAFSRMKLAEALGFPKYEGIIVTSKKTVEDALDTLLEFIKTSDIVCDGVVIKADSHKVRNILGVGNKFTKYQHCFKPQNLSAQTILLDIEYGLGRTGKITPIAILQPVDLGGAVVSRANLCNETYLENLGIKIGATVTILRSGDVIPYITGVVNSKNGKLVVFPTNCPVCNSLLRIRDNSGITQRFCDNSGCPGKSAEQFVYIGHRDTLEIDNLGASMADELVSFGITNIAELFEFGNLSLNAVASFSNSKQNDLALASRFKNDGFRSGVNTVKLVKSLETAKSATWERWIASLNIPMVGHSLGKDIAIALNLTSDDIGNLPNLLLKLPAMNLDKLGPVKTASIADWANNTNNVTLCARLYNDGVRPTGLTVVKPVAGGLLNDIVFCITGELAHGTRKEVEAMLTALGATAVSDIKKECNLLIVGEKPGSKLANAQKKNVKIVHEDWLTEVLGK
jgi:DNA ligase (NAD+)